MRRWWLLSAIRIALFSLPSFRSMGMGLSLMLNHLPRPGVRGAAKDWGRILLGTLGRLSVAGSQLAGLEHCQAVCPGGGGTAAGWLGSNRQRQAHACSPALLARPNAGTRLASSVIVGLALPQRPIVTLATQAVLSLLIPNSPGYCQSQVSQPAAALRTTFANGLPALPCANQGCVPSPSPPQLLATPLTKQRMLAVATGLEAAALPLMVFAPSGVQWMQGAYKILDGKLSCGFVDRSRCCLLYNDQMVVAGKGTQQCCRLLPLAAVSAGARRL